MVRQLRGELQGAHTKVEQTEKDCILKIRSKELEVENALKDLENREVVFLYSKNKKGEV